MANIDYVKTIVRSVMTSSPGSINVGQLMTDYKNLEGESIPFKRLGYTTIFELLKNMNDVIRVPQNPNMNSLLSVIVNEKTTHLRELVTNQKRKKPRPRNSGGLRRNGNFNSCSALYYPPTDYKLNNARGYNHVNTYAKPLNYSTVTARLKKFLEDECKRQPEGVPLNTFMQLLLKHPDYKQINTASVQDAVNKLKFFIYIHRNRVYLKSSNPMMNSSYNYNENTPKTTRAVSLQNINNHDEYLNEMEYLDPDFDDIDDEEMKEEFILAKAIKPMDNNSSNGDNFQKSTNSENSDEHSSSLQSNSKLEENPLKITKTMSLTELQRPSWSNQISNQNCQMTNTSLSMRNVTSLKTTQHVKSQLLKNNIKNRFNNKNENSPRTDMDYKEAIIKILSDSYKQMTVTEVLEKFLQLHGFEFPFQHLSCRTAMDFFRLYPADFKLQNQYSTSSIVKLAEPPKQAKNKRTSSIRLRLFRYSIDNVTQEDISEFMERRNEKIPSTLPLAKTNSHSYSVELVNGKCNSTSNISKFEEYDSHMINDKMKDKMRTLISKYKDGIKSNEFIDMYEKMYKSKYTFHEYGFKSMSDMALKLPSVFHVEVIDESNECILFHADRRSEHTIGTVPSSKNIPKTILYNLSILFDKHRLGVPLDEVTQLYYTEFGKHYDNPTKYGFCSDKQMFESLSDMVEIKNNMLITKNANAYIDFVDRSEIYEENHDIIRPALPENSFFNTFGEEICNDKFKYVHLSLTKGKAHNVFMAEIYNPQSFYVNLAIYESNLNKMMDELQEYYNSNQNEYEIPAGLISEGLACVCIFEESVLWHRAIVLKVIDVNSVRLFYVDYGSIENVQKSQLRLLVSHFGSLPAQGIHCSLFNHDSIQTISRETNELFVSLVTNKTLTARHIRIVISEYCNFPKYIVSVLYENNKQKIDLKKEIMKTISVTPNENMFSVRQKIAKCLSEV